MASGSKIWTVRGVPAELQAAVSAAAKAGRQTLGEWTAAALSNALGSGEAQSSPPPTSSSRPLPPAEDAATGERLAVEKLMAVEARLAALERVVEGLGHRTEGTQFRVDGLEQQAEAVDRRLATLISIFGQRLDALEARGGALEARGGYPAPASASEDVEPPLGLFTKGLGGRKRLTSAGEEELQRLLAIGADDATIAARLGIHKRIVWARRQTDNGAD